MHLTGISLLPVLDQTVSDASFLEKTYFYMAHQLLTQTAKYMYN